MIFGSLQDKSLDVPLWSSLSILNPFDSLEVCVLRPQFRTVLARGRENDTVGQGQLQFHAEPRRVHGNRRSQVHDGSLLQDRRRVKRRALVALLEHSLENFEENQCGDYKRLGVLNKLRKEGGVRTIDEIF